MVKCHRLGSRSRRWPAIYAAALRRKLIDAVACGCAASRRRQSRDAATLSSKPPPENPKPRPMRNLGSDRLSELLKAEISDSESDLSFDDNAEFETRRKIEAFEELQGAVRGLQWECGERRRAAAAAVRRLAKDDTEARERLAMLGAIPPLIGMIDSDDLESQISSLYALLNLGIGNDTNKAAIVKAGAVHKMLNLIKSRTPPASISEAVVANFLGLSALDPNKPIIGTSGAIPFLIRTFQFPTSSQSQQDSLRALFNLSICPSNIPHLVASRLVPHLLSSVGDTSLTDRVLAVLSNLVSAPDGRRALTKSGDGVAILIDVLDWIDSPSCQEKAAYILMVIAHKSDADRPVMVSLGIKSALLELVLVGSTLAQKRASRILEILRADKGKQVSEGCVGLPAVSAPLIVGKREEEEEEEEEAGMSEERRAVRELVNESLQSNLKRIARRANLGAAVTGSSKSLPL